MISGRTQQHLGDIDGRCMLHKDVISPFRLMQQAAALEGIDMQIVSGFRSYDRQLMLWNAKASGSRRVLDSMGCDIAIENLDETARAYAILRWSALPGCSRHHWGTDLDVWDIAAVPANYSLQLTPQEYEAGGPFYDLHCWLQQYAHEFGFIRPYWFRHGKTLVDGVAPEPWHLSYATIASNFEARLDNTLIKAIVNNQQLQLRQAVLDNLDDIVTRFIRVM